MRAPRSWETPAISALAYVEMILGAMALIDGFCESMAGRWDPALARFLVGFGLLGFLALEIYLDNETTRSIFYGALSVGCLAFGLLCFWKFGPLSGIAAVSVSALMSCGAICLEAKKAERT